MRILIADDEPLICEMLERLIHFEELGLELSGKVYNGYMELEKIEELQPEIVITDISMPGIDGLECIRRIKEKGSRCKFVIISGFREFEYAYNALKYNVEDYLLKPIDEDELNAALKKLVEEISREENEAEGQEHHEAIRRLFVSRTILEMKEEMSLEEINRIYSTKFQPGLFQFMLIRTDFSEQVKMIFDNISSFQTKVMELTRQRLTDYCFDLLFDYRFNGLVILADIRREREEDFRNTLEDLLQDVRNAADMFSDMKVTICVGRPCEKALEIKESRRTAYDTSWARMMRGINRVLYYREREEPFLLQYIDRQKELEEVLRKACELHDKKKFVAAVTEIFSMPAVALEGHVTRKVLQNTKEFFFEINSSFIDEVEDSENAHKKLHRMLDFCLTAEQYKKTYIEQFSKLFDLITERTAQQKILPVRQAMNYVEEHYCNNITLEDIAEIVNLNPVYFSALFKKETGKNFTEYVTEYRIKIAKSLLKKKDYNINEIAGAVGYSDSHYFGRIFKKYVGINPTAYRKMYL